MARLVGARALLCQRDHHPTPDHPEQRPAPAAARLRARTVPYLREVSQRVGGIPLCLEWVATLVQDPLLLDDWQGFDLDEDVDMQGNHAQSDNEMTQRLQRLLAEPALLRGHIATKLKPLLERIIEKRLSAEARHLLDLLAVTTIPLGKAALKVLIERPGPLKGLRDASLLVAYPHRVQLLPMVASAVLQQLPPEQVRELEEQLIQALNCWLEEGTISDREAGNLVTELTVLLLKQHRLLDAAQLLIRYGWLSFNLGDASRLAQLAEDVMQQFDWHGTADDQCGGLLLDYFLSPFLGKIIDVKKRVEDYYHIRDEILAGKVVLQPPIEVAITYHLMVCAINELQFEDARALLEACRERLAPHLPSNVDLQASLLEKHAWLLGRWSEYAEEQGQTELAKELQEQAIALYRQSITLLSTNGDSSPLKNGFLKKRLARAFNNLGYHLNRIGQCEEALEAIERSITLKEQGYVEVDTLAEAYGEKSQILANLGRFQEAVLFDEKAITEVQCLANTGNTFSREEVWIYRVNRGRLYLRLGRIEEAERLLQEALPNIPARRRMYRVFAEEASNEIERWRKTKSSQYQLDWRWVDRYRQLASFDSYWWLAPAGPFNEEEQQQWDQLYSHSLDEATKERLGTIIAQSRERDLLAAIAEQREPRLYYPAVAIEEVRSRITDLLQLDEEISQDEPNAIVRRL
jgi:tetratricopeptide (TPR) repeat protein